MHPGEAMTDSDVNGVGSTSGRLPRLHVRTLPCSRRSCGCAALADAGTEEALVLGDLSAEHNQ